MSFLWTLSELRTPFGDAVFGVVTRIGEETLAIVVICALFWCVKKELAYLIGFSYFLSGLLVQGLKITFRIPRPWVLDPSFQAVESALPAATGYSFPSGHTQSATALFSVLGFRSNRIYAKILCFVLAVLVGFSRMYLGVHTPADVLTGFAISLLLSALLCWAVDRVELTPKTDLLLLCALLLIASSLLAYSLALYGSGAIAREYAVDCCKAAGAGIGFALGFYLERRFIRFDPRAASLPIQLVKFVLGIAGLLALKSGLKLLIGTSMAADTIRYAVIVLWALVLFPLLIKKWFSRGAVAEKA